MSNTPASPLRRVLANAFAILTSDVFNRATTFVLYAMVARQLGTFAFGQMSLALTFFYVFQVLAVAGLHYLITRDVAKNKRLTGPYLANGAVIVGAFFALSAALLLLSVVVMGYQRSTAAIIILIAVGLLPYALSQIIEAVFRAWEEMDLIAMANVPTNIVKMGAAIVYLLSDAPVLVPIIILIVAAYTQVFLLEAFFLWKRIIRPNQINLQLGISQQFLRQTVQATWAFLGLEIVIAVNASMAVLLLSWFTNEETVALYSSAIQLMIPVTLVFKSIVTSLFPMMSRRFEKGFVGMKEISQHMLEWLLLVALPTSVGLYFVADDALLLLYDDPAFIDGVPALQIMAWSLISVALTTALGQVLLAGLKEKVTLRIVVINLLFGLAVETVLIWQYGLIGAAWGALLAAVVNYVQHHVEVAKVLKGLSLHTVIWKPAIASGLMAAGLYTLQEQPLFVQIGSGVVIYAVAFMLLAMISHGSVREMKAYYTAGFEG